MTTTMKVSQMQLQTTGELAKRFKVHPRQISRIAYERFQPGELPKGERVRQVLIARGVLQSLQEYV